MMDLTVIGSAHLLEEPKGANGGTPPVIEQPVAWISRESLWRLKQGGNHAGVVPVHAKRSNTSYIALYVKEVA